MTSFTYFRNILSYLFSQFDNSKILKDINVTRGNLFFFPLSSLLHESIMHTVTDQTRVCLVSWLAVPEANTFCWDFLQNFPATRPNSHKMSENCWFMLCTFWHLSAGFHRFSKHLFQYNLSFWQQLVPVSPWFSFLLHSTVSNNVHVKKYNEVKGGKCCPALLDIGPCFLQKKNCLHCYTE